MTRKCGEEEQALQPAAARDALGQGLKAGGGAGRQQQPENRQAPERANNVENVADAAEGMALASLSGGRV